MEVRDVYKLLYQGTRGPEHLIRSPEDFTARLYAEFTCVPPDDGEPLVESIAPDGSLLRLNLRPFKARGGEENWLVEACLETGERQWGRESALRATWRTFVRACQEGQFTAFSLDEVITFSDWLENQGFPAVHHSQVYREAYRPAYRLVAADLCPPGYKD